MAWYDEKLNIGMFEPVCTRKDYRMHGIGKAMLKEGMRRLKEKGVEKAYVESWGITDESFIIAPGLPPMTEIIRGKRSFNICLRGRRYYGYFL